MNQVVIKKRKLKAKEIDLLMSEIKRTPYIIGHSQREWLSFQNVFLAEINNVFAGVCVNKNLGFNWVEIGPILILEKFRGAKIGKKLFAKAFDWAELKKKNIYMVSGNPVVINWMKDRGMKTQNHIFGLPWPIIWRDIVMVFSLYRISEFLRKSSLHRQKSKYIYGYKIAK